VSRRPLEIRRRLVMEMELRGSVIMADMVECSQCLELADIALWADYGVP
jgi:hypothetical protein